MNEYDTIVNNVEKVKDALRLAQSALEAVDYKPLSSGHAIYAYVCSWCDADRPHHAPDCARKLALDAIKEVRGE